MSKFALCLLLLSWYAEVCPSAGDPTGTRCDKVVGAPSCVCKSPKGVIDLTKIANFDGTPRFTGIKDPNAYGLTYDYNPCVAFTGEYDCASSGVQVCLHDLAANYSYSVADSPEEMWIGNDGEPYVYYTQPGFGETYITLVCDPSASEPIVTTTGYSEVNRIFNFTVRSVHACPSGHVPPKPGPIDKCEAVDGAPSCVCRTDHGVIDLTKIASYNGTPSRRFTGLKDPNGFSYDYNPCFPFSSGNGSCTNVHVCQTPPSNETKYAIADYGSEVMRVENGTTYVYYTGLMGRETFVYLECDHTERGEPILTTTGDAETFLVYKFYLISCHACPGGCSFEDDDNPSSSKNKV